MMGRFLPGFSLVEPVDFASAGSGDTEFVSIGPFVEGTPLDSLVVYIFDGGGTVASIHVDARLVGATPVTQAVFDASERLFGGNVRLAIGDLSGMGGGGMPVPFRFPLSGRIVDSDRYLAFRLLDNDITGGAFEGYVAVELGLSLDLPP